MSCRGRLYSSRSRRKSMRTGMRKQLTIELSGWQLRCVYYR
eukprot:COSAG06_NODE_1349_length_9776_cov_110.373049_9_plen_41_part_00